MIPIFENEIIDGLSDKIQASKTVAYLSPVSKRVLSDKVPMWLTKAAVTDMDLYQVKSILVTSTWNKNDDVFDRLEVWKARRTPEDKPDNLNHEEHRIVGHMTGNWAVNEDMEIIPDDTKDEDVPDVYHILTSGVIYLRWDDPKMRSDIETLINKIEAGEMFVSMECLLRNFDYALMNEEGKAHVVARTKESSFLTKHLRAYGGTGEYNGYKVGRLLRDITFCGKGYVENPANPQSVIVATADTSFAFSKASKINPFLNDGGVSIQCNHNSMENKMDEKQVKELNDKLAALTASLSEKDVELANVKAANAEAVKVAQDALKASTDELNAAKASLADSEKKAGELAAALATIKANEKKASRLAKLVEAGIAKEEATTKVEKLVSLDDEAFDVVVSLAGAKAPVVVKVEETDEDDKNEKNADASLEKTKSSEIVPVVPVVSEEEANASRLAGLADSVKSLLESRVTKKAKK